MAVRAILVHILAYLAAGLLISGCGILIGTEDSSGTTKRFRAREYPDSLTVPELTVTFTRIPVSAFSDDFATWARIKNLYR